MWSCCRRSRPTHPCYRTLPRPGRARSGTRAPRGCAASTSPTPHPTVTGSSRSSRPARPTSPRRRPRSPTRLQLSLAAIEASPAASRDGLAGAASWFWLGEAPGEQQRSLFLDGETVTVTADPSQISWSFGDGTTLEGGAGIPYRAGGAPAAAVTHVYQSRCLPGDQGRDPYVLASCGSDGYQVSASASWTISFTATGPLTESGQLPTRSSESGLAYPVSEARAFLTGGSG